MGIVQYGIRVLVFMLVLFDDPLCLAQPYMGVTYSIIQSIFESMFISTLLMFWLLYIHAISANTFMNITAKRFFLPKIILCCLFFIYLVTMRMFVYLQFEKDPFFNAILSNHSRTLTYQWIYLVGVVLTFLYLFYMGLLIYIALKTIKTFQRNYRITTGATILTIVICLLLLFLNGQSSQRMDIRLFVSLYVLLNLHVHSLAYMYTPSVEYLAESNNEKDSGLTESERERNKIMNEFYSVEMQDMSRTEEDDDIIELNSGQNSTREVIEEEKNEKEDNLSVRLVQNREEDLKNR